MEIEKQIDQKIGEVRTEPLDLSYGEIINLHMNKELVIQPEYQRLFRWSDEQNLVLSNQYYWNYPSLKFL
jgi:hypothetical protein